ncbi:hypothetical protein BJ878DRAFT_54999 [Calycina marina]|uniref:Uncharacterized protein n=1 Tax=Calycina marina TaxID=1763456 RepID=A0A9P7ZBA4_9HELO|nr:hypothetical protein BJ878DRAFT_54999 [Calycina marina]
MATEIGLSWIVIFGTIKLSTRFSLHTKLLGMNESFLLISIEHTLPQSTSISSCADSSLHIFIHHHTRSLCKRLGKVHRADPIGIPEADTTGRYTCWGFVQEHLLTVYRMYYISNLMFIPTVSASKVSIALPLLQITPQNLDQQLLRASIVLLAVWTLASAFVVALQCNFSHPWVAVGERWPHIVSFASRLPNTLSSP